MKQAAVQQLVGGAFLENARDDYWDYLKGILIFFVVAMAMFSSSEKFLIIYII